VRKIPGAIVNHPNAEARQLAGDGKCHGDDANPSRPHRRLAYLPVISRDTRRVDHDTSLFVTAFHIVKTSGELRKHVERAKRD